eukprot:COSAG01_NODE_1206_length_11242_cov_29.405905_7_plen_160_part_00
MAEVGATLALPYGELAACAGGVAAGPWRSGVVGAMLSNAPMLRLVRASLPPHTALLRRPRTARHTHGLTDVTVCSSAERAWVRSCGCACACVGGEAVRGARARAGRGGGAGGGVRAGGLGEAAACLGEPKRLVVESPWSHLTSECQRFGHPPRLDKQPF